MTNKDSNMVTILPSGIESENKNSRTVAFSKQLVEVNPGQTAEVEIYQVPMQNALRISEFTIRHFSCQAIQDMQCELLLDSLAVWRSGSYQKGYRRTTRTPFEGAPCSVISRADATGYHDNFTEEKQRIFEMARGNQVVKLRLTNQSQVYTHTLLVGFSGWEFPINLLEKKDADAGNHL